MLVPFASIPSLCKASVLHAAVLVCALGLAGCDTVTGYPYARMSPYAPPEPVAEEHVVADDPTIEIWHPGYWNFNGADFTWVPGVLVPRPDPTAAWMPDRWEERGYGWAFVTGYWM